MENNILQDFIVKSLAEDIGEGDHSSLACIPENAQGKAKLLIKEQGIIAGLAVAQSIFTYADNTLLVDMLINDGSEVKPGDIAFYISGSQRSILSTERLILNVMQRMSGIATRTRDYVNQLKGLKTKILDTRKTSPGLRFLEKDAVRIGGGVNHRMGLYDMIMLKDNHIDFAGGIRQAIEQTHVYLERINRKIFIEIEARDLFSVREILSIGGVDRIMLDNFTVTDTMIAVDAINGRYETESSGGITIENLRSYAECGVDYISVGALTHHIKSLDMSLKAM